VTLLAANGVLWIVLIVVILLIVVAVFGRGRV
jgi:flagellar basal body-associated protein FliL